MIRFVKNTSIQLKDVNQTINQSINRPLIRATEQNRLGLACPCPKQLSGLNLYFCIGPPPPLGFHISLSVVSLLMNPAESTSFTIAASKQKADLSDVGIQDLEKRFRSKREMHDFLVQDCKAFLPKLPSTSIFFMKAIIKAEKDVSLLFSKSHDQG